MKNLNPNFQKPPGQENHYTEQIRQFKHHPLNPFTTLVFFNPSKTVKNPAASCGASSKEKAKMGAAAPKPPHAIHPRSKLWGILAFSHETMVSLT